MMPDLPFVVFDEFDDILGDVALLGTYFIVEVVAVERGFEHLGIHHVQVFLDVALHFRGGGGGEGDDGSLADFFHDGADIAVFGAEVVSPFGDAVGFIDSEERDFYLFQEVHVAFFGQRFGGDEQHFGFPLQDVFLDAQNLALGKGRVQEVSDAFRLGEGTHGVHWFSSGQSVER